VAARSDPKQIIAALKCGRPGCTCAKGKQVHCPAHNDEHPSLSVDERDGQILVHCFAGCSQYAVIDGLRAHGLWTGPPPTPRVTGPLFDVLRFVQQYVVLPSDHAAVAVALWVAHCWAIDAFEVSPYLAILSPEKRAGKTRLLEVLELLCPRAWRIVQPSSAVLFRKIAQDVPTLLLDEGDAIFNSRGEQYEPLRALLNAGFKRGTVVPRCVGEGAHQKLINFTVFCPKAIAAIGNLPDTITDRSILIKMDRASPEEQRRLVRLRSREAEVEAQPIRDALERWAEAAVEKLRDARPDVPTELDGRAADGWEVLLAVADQAGDGWSALAWTAALKLSTGAAREDESLRTRLLGDLRRVFEERAADQLATTEIIDALCEDDSSPWSDWHGRRITPHTLGRLLRPFGIVPVKWRDGDRAGIRGYTRASFAAAWSHYLPLEPPQTPQSALDAAFDAISEAPQRVAVADAKNGETPRQMRSVALVALSTPPERGDGPLATSPEGQTADFDRLVGLAKELFNAEIVYDGPPRTGAWGMPLADGRRLAFMRKGHALAWVAVPAIGVGEGMQAWRQFALAHTEEEVGRALLALERLEALGDPRDA
jgi:hypothetical protein